MSERDRRSDLAVMDAQEFKQKRRLQRLLDAREKVEQKSDEAEELFVAGQIDERARDTMVLEAVREYLREGWTLLLDHAQAVREDDPEGQSEYLESRVLGQMQVGNETVTFEGLWDFLHAKKVFVAEYERKVSYRQGPNQTVREVEHQSVPLDISWQAFLTMNEFLADVHDLELQFEETNDGPDLWGYDTVDLDELGIETIEDIEEAIESGVDARALTNGDGDGDE